jgi:hypothetical protein
MLLIREREGDRPRQPLVVLCPHQDTTYEYTAHCGDPDTLQADFACAPKKLPQRFNPNFLPIL